LDGEVGKKELELQSMVGEVKSQKETIQALSDELRRRSNSQSAMLTSSVAQSLQLSEEDNELRRSF
jgi:ribosomal protein L18E